MGRICPKGQYVLPNSFSRWFDLMLARAAFGFVVPVATGWRMVARRFVMLLAVGVVAADGASAQHSSRRGGGDRGGGDRGGGDRGDAIAESTGEMAEDFRVVAAAVEGYCIDCHNGAEASGGLDAESLRFAPTVAARPDWDTEPWEKMLRRLQGRQMPPPGSARPTEPEYRRLIGAMTRVLDRRAREYPKPGRTSAIRRLTRTEYRNAIRDLLAIEVDAEALLPGDPVSHGFDNVTVAELSPSRLNRYIAAAEKISRAAIGRPPKVPDGITVRVPADVTQESHVAGLPLGTRGGTVVRHLFPSDGDYEVQLRLARDRDERVEGLHREHAIDVLVDRLPVHRFTVKPPPGGKDFTKVDAHLRVRIPIDAGPHDIGVTFPRGSSPLDETRREPPAARYNRHRHPRRNPALFEVSIVGPFSSDDTSSSGVASSSGDMSNSEDGNVTGRESGAGRSRGSLDGRIAGGPGDTPSRRIVFAPLSENRHEYRFTEDGIPRGLGEQRRAAEAILGRLMRVAYRRPVDGADLRTPLEFFERERAVSGFEAGIESALAAILVNPHFLFRVERDPLERDVLERGLGGAEPGSAYRVSDIELASRLSFFLWSSLPDETLLSLAERGELSEPDTLRGQVARMLGDARSEALVENFASQWLYLRNLESITPDLRRFPDFDHNLREAFREETLWLFRDMLRHDRSVLDLIDTDHAHLNERLARHYGIPHVFGSHFRRVELEPRDRRGGLLRQGSILMVTSYATRTSPTVRGSWILENIFGTPPPPPPPNVPSLEEKKDFAEMSVRERLAAHRDNPSCASCHRLMDPVGFAMENFDAVGRWRAWEEGEPIDASGALPDGTEVDGVEGLEAGIIARPEMFVGTLAEKLLTHALGRGIEPSDGPSVRRVVREASRADYRFSRLVEAIVLSPPFRMRSLP